MTDDTYNGWTNRETWLVNLWLNNDEAPYLEACQIARTHPDSSDLWLGEAIESEIVNPMCGQDDAQGFKLDALNAFLARVDWREIGQGFRESVTT